MRVSLVRVFDPKRSVRRSLTCIINCVFCAGQRPADITFRIAGPHERTQKTSSKTLLKNSCKVIPAATACCGTRLASVMPGTVLTSII